MLNMKNKIKNKIWNNYNQIKKAFFDCIERDKFILNLFLIGFKFKTNDRLNLS